MIFAYLMKYLFNYSALEKGILVNSINNKREFLLIEWMMLEKVSERTLPKV